MLIEQIDNITELCREQSDAERAEPSQPMIVLGPRCLGDAIDTVADAVAA